MKIKWLGHACFLITSDNGTRVLTDPFNEEVGYELPAVAADIVTTSHDHYDHNYIAAVKGDFVHINQPGSYNEKGIIITGVSSFHDEQGGAKRGKNIIFIFSVDGIRVCNCGDLGHVLTNDQIKKIGTVDVLMVPTGGTYTLDYLGALEVVNQLNPVITIPMHFKTPDLKFPLDGIDKFLNAAGGQYYNSPEIELNGECLQSMAGIRVLNYM